MTRADILNTLRDEIESTIKSTNSPYTSDIAEVKRGAYGFSEATNKPFMGIAQSQDGVDQETFDTVGTDQIRRLVIVIHCYMVGNGLGDTTKMDTMISDLEYFLKYDFTYSNITYEGTLVTLEGGIPDNLVAFTLNVECVYQIDI